MDTRLTDAAAPTLPAGSGAPPPTRQQIAFARSTVAARLPVTPLWSHDGWQYKTEHRQPTGSFKVRGALTALSQAALQGNREVIAASAGNHGAAVAWAAAQLGIRATIVVPANCPAIKRQKMEQLAHVIVHPSAGYDEAQLHAQELAAARGVRFISPYDDPWVAAGNGASLMHEILAQQPYVSTVVLPVGGGGLLSGVLAVLDAYAPEVRVVPVQSLASPAFVRSLADNAYYAQWPAADTLAEGLEGGAGATAVAMAKSRGLRAFAVCEQDIRVAMLDLYARWGSPIEGSAAVVEAARSLPDLPDLGPHPVAVLTGGNVAVETLVHLQNETPWGTTSEHAARAAEPPPRPQH